MALHSVWHLLRPFAWAHAKEFDRGIHASLDGAVVTKRILLLHEVLVSQSIPRSTEVRWVDWPHVVGGCNLHWIYLVLVVVALLVRLARLRVHVLTRVLQATAVRADGNCGLIPPEANIRHSWGPERHLLNGHDQLLFELTILFFTLH